MSLHELIGIAAGILELLSLPIYVSSILKGKTKPDRVTWWVLALVSGMITASYFASGARETIWLPLVYTISFIVVGALSIKYGEGPLTLDLIDRVSLIGALASAFIWWSLKSPVPALFMNIATEFIGLVPTINKSYRRPWTENKAAWVIGSIASLLNVLAINEWTFVIAAYPIYVFVTNTIITHFITRKKAPL